MVTDDKPMLTPAMIRAARGLLGFDQAKLAELTGLTQRTISKLEGQSELSTKDIRRRKVLDAIRAAFEEKGIVFTYPDEASGPGVRLRREALSTDPSSQRSQGQA